MSKKITTKTFFFKVNVTSDLLPEMEAQMKTDIAFGISRAFDGWKNTAVTVEDVKPPKDDKSK